MRGLMPCVVFTFAHVWTVNYKLWVICTVYTSKIIKHVLLNYKEFHQIEIYGHCYTSSKSRSRRSTCIMAIWPNCIGKITDHNCTSEDVRVRVIEYFVSHIPIITDIQNQEHILAKVNWYDDRCTLEKLGLEILL